MAERTVKLTAPDGSPIGGAPLAADFRAAEKIGPFRIGLSAFYYRDGLKTRCIPFTGIDRAFTRVEPVNAHCCCSMGLAIYRLVLCFNGRELADISTDDKSLVDKAQALLKERIPEMKLGYVKPTA